MLGKSQRRSQTGSPVLLPASVPPIPMSACVYRSVPRDAKSKGRFMCLWKSLHPSILLHHPAFSLSLGSAQTICANYAELSLQVLLFSYSSICFKEFCFANEIYSSWFSQPFFFKASLSDFSEPVLASIWGCAFVESA